MNLTTWNPLREFDDLLSDYRRMLGRRMVASGDQDIRAMDLRWQPVADVAETEAEYLVKIELPEVKREDIQVTVADGMLRVEGERRIERKSDAEKPHRTESLYGKFYRGFSLPADVDDSADIEAKCKDGVLTIRLPKSETKREERRQIPVS